MRIVSDIKRTGDSEYTFKAYRDIEEGRYTLSISKYRESRTLKQNAYMWELITEIADKENGGRSTEEMRMDLYTRLLEQAGAVAVSLEIGERDYDAFMRSRVFRAVRFVGFDPVTDRFQFIGYIGTSHMDTKQMSSFIDCVLDYAASVGIQTESWEELLRYEEHNAEH